MRTLLHNLLAVNSLVILVGCGGGSGGDASPVQPSSGPPLQGVVEITYPDNYDDSIEANQINESGFGVGILSLASDQTASQTDPAFCFGGFAFTTDDREAVVASGIASPELSIPISQRDVIVNGINAVEFLYIDLPDPDDDDDNIPLTALGHQYYLSTDATNFTENVELFLTCASTENGFAIHEPVFRSILNSMVIE